MSIVLAVAVATQVEVEWAKQAIQGGGYWFAWCLVLASLGFGIRVCRRPSRAIMRWWRGAGPTRRWAPLLIVAAGSVFLHLHFTHQFKVLMDEATLVNTSQALHQHRRLFTPATAEYRNGVFLVDEGYIDKRPFLFPFVVSIVHDLTGYRPTNGIWLNAAITPCLVALFFLLGRRLWRRYGGGLGVLLAVGVPIFGHTVTGGGFEMLNLTLLLMLICAGAYCLRHPTRDTVSWVICLGLMLAYTRYESGLYLLATGAIVWAALRSGKVCGFPKSAFVAPFACVPLVWLQLVAFSDERGYFQLEAKGDLSAFSSTYLAGNLSSAFQFFVVPAKVNLSSPAIAVVGFVALAGLLIAIAKAPRLRSAREKAVLLLALICGVTLANAAIFLFFNYGQYASFITQRISVPIWGAFIAATLWFFGRFSGAWPRVLVLALGWGNLVVFYLPAANGDFYTREYLEGKNCAFVLDYSRELGREEGVLVYSFAPIPWLAVQRPSVSFGRAPERIDDVLANLQSGRYHRVLVHVMEYSPAGDRQVGERHRPPAWFHAAEKKLIAERWMHTRIVNRIYELANPQAASAVHLPEAAR